MDNYYKSHKLFFTLSTHEKLNEFLKRADKSTNILENNINHLLKNDLYCKVKLNANKSKYNKQGNKTNMCTQIVIEYYNSNNILLGHLTFHLEPEKKDNRGNPIKFGRFHLTNNRNKQLRHVLQIDETSLNNYNKSIKFNIKYPYHKNDLKECRYGTIKILNKYFNLDINEPLSIDKRLSQHYSYYLNSGEIIQSYWHKCFEKIRKSFNSLQLTSKERLRKFTIKKKHYKANKTLKQ